MWVKLPYKNELSVVSKINKQVNLRLINHVKKFHFFLILIMVSGLLVQL